MREVTAGGAHFIEPHNEPQVVSVGWHTGAGCLDIKPDPLIAAPVRAIKRQNEVKEASAVLTRVRQTAVKFPGEHMIRRIVGINGDLQRPRPVGGRVGRELAEAAFIDPNPVVKVIR